jgi:GT2 family glycosyltransferase
MKYSIVIPTYNHCEKYLKPCVESVIKYTDMNDVDLVISANGCTDNTKEYLEELKSAVPHLYVVWSKDALGFAEACNRGIRVCNGDKKIVLLNNDTVLLDQPKNKWLERLDGHDISGVKTLYSPETKQLFAVFFCVMIDPKVFYKVGLLNTEYGTGGGEDIEFCAKALEMGFKVHDEGWRGDFPIYHVGEGTVHDTDLVPDYHTTFADNMKKLAAKYE